MSVVCYFGNFTKAFDRVNYCILFSCFFVFCSLIYVLLCYCKCMLDGVILYLVRFIIGTKELSPYLFTRYVNTALHLMSYFTLHLYV